MMRVSIDHPTDKPNFTRVVVGDLILWFSYSTPIAFKVIGDSRYTVRVNEWGPTTGRHLNYVDDGDHATRLRGYDFEAALDALGDTAYVLNR